MSFSGDNVYTPIQFPARIDLRPHQLDRNIYSTIEELAKKKFSGKCIPKHGYVKPGSVYVAKKQIGKYYGSHFTGNMTFMIMVGCEVTKPIKGQKITALVMSKNDSALIAENPMLPYKLYVPKMPNDPNADKIDNVNRNNRIIVEVQEYELRAPDIEVKRAEYWVICKLSEIDLSDVRRLDLPPVINLSSLTHIVSSYDELNDQRNELTDSMYESLQHSKSLIEEMNTNYAKKIKSMPIDKIKKDLVFQTVLERFKFGRGNNVPEYVLVYINEVITSNQLSVTVVINNGATDLQKTKDQFKITVPDDYYYSDTLLVIKVENGNLTQNVNTVDIWSNHIKYVVNQYEMIHPDFSYITQIKQINKNNDLKLAVPSQNNNVINRAYFKMVELIKHVNIKPTSMNIACIAESPGGFIQALFNYRTLDNSFKFLDNAVFDNIVGMSIPVNSHQKTWEKLERKLRYDHLVIKRDSQRFTDQPIPNKTLIQLLGDKPEEGDLLSAKSRDQLYVLFPKGNKADLVTADGGIGRDKSSSDTEEMELIKLIIAEIITTLNIQATGGSFVLKIFDSATRPMMACLSILSYCYDTVSIFKPVTSRNASSEKYVVCNGFRAEEKQIEDMTESLTNIINHELEPDQYFGKIMVVEDEEIVRTVTRYNGIYMKKQSDFIISGSEYADQYISTIGNIKGLSDLIQAYVKRQEKNADEFKMEHHL